MQVKTQELQIYIKKKLGEEQWKNCFANIEKRIRT
jgi:ribosomal protein L31E